MVQKIIVKYIVLHTNTQSHLFPAGVYPRVYAAAIFVIESPVLLWYTTNIFPYTEIVSDSQIINLVELTSKYWENKDIDKKIESINSQDDKVITMNDNPIIYTLTIIFVKPRHRYSGIFNNSITKQYLPISEQN